MIVKFQLIFYILLRFSMSTSITDDSEYLIDFAPPDGFVHPPFCLVSLDYLDYLADTFQNETVFFSFNVSSGVPMGCKKFTMKKRNLKTIIWNVFGHSVNTDTTWATKPQTSTPSTQSEIQNTSSPLTITSTISDRNDTATNIITTITTICQAATDTDTSRPTASIIDQLKPTNQLNSAIVTQCIRQIAEGKINLAMFTFFGAQNEPTLSRIIKDSYNVTNLNRILIFIENLIEIDNEKYLIGYVKLMDEIIRSNNIYKDEIFLLAKSIRKSESVCQTNYCQNVIDQLRKRLPECVNTIFWSEMVCIKSKFFDEYLYADVKLLSTDRRYIFTSKTNKMVQPLGSIWQFIPIENGKYFNIKNIFYNEFMYASADNIQYDADRRRVINWIPGSVDETGKWQLEIISKNIINIKNVKYNYEYFYPAQIDFDKDKREVFTWRPGNCDAQCQWTVIDCGNV